MGLLDDLKSRLGFGDRQEYWDEDQNPDHDYDEYGNDSYAEGDGNSFDDGSRNRLQVGDYTRGEDTAGRGRRSSRQDPLRSFGVDRADYYTDEHSPLVSLSDVRSQRSLTSSLNQQPQDRIPTPTPIRRGGATVAPKDDPYAYREGLARSSVNSLTYMQRERQRLDQAAFGSDKEKVKAGDSSFQLPRPTRVGSAAVGARSSRQLDVIRPFSYSEAEQVTRSLKNGNVAVISLVETRPELAKRILDFAFGAASALDAVVDRYADKVFVITRGSALTAEERDLLRARGIH